MKQYDVFILKEDLNSEIKAGQKGVILEVYNDEQVEVEFIKPDGSNFEYMGQYTFTVTKVIIEIIT